MLISASFTPFNDDSSLNLGSVGALYSNLIDQGVTGTMVCGTTGEGYSMSNNERKQLVEEWAGIVDENFKLYVHVGHNNIPDIRELSIHAAKQGVGAIVLSAPTFFKPVDVKDLIQFLKYSIIEDYGIKVYYYHIPSMTGVNFLMADLLKEADAIDLNLAGIKYTHDDLDDFSRCSNYQDGKYGMMFGRDELYLEALEKGAKVALGSTYNYMGRLFIQIKEEYEKGNREIAFNLQNEARKIIELLIKYGGGVVGGKAFMKLIGIDCGPVRTPLKSVSSDNLKQLKFELENTLFYQYVN